jgi:molybdopterin molybdotransferase
MADACAAATSFDTAQGQLRAAARPLGIERVPLARAGRRILAEPVIARIDSPRRDVSAMDGFAVRSADLTTGIRSFRLTGASFAGGTLPAALDLGRACAVATGSPMPPGGDQVIPNELVRAFGDGIEIDSVPAKPHLRRRGSDFAAGVTLLAPGTTIESRALVVAAAADLDVLAVWRRPRVRVIVNGDELARAGSATESTGAVPDSLSDAIQLMARQWGARPRGAALVPDNAHALAEAARAALAECDVLVIAGGASRGARDYVRQALLPLGLAFDFVGVAMKPGKPIWYGRIGATHVLGLPGNPTAALTTARLFLAPLVAALGGGQFNDALHWFDLPAMDAVPCGGDRDSFLCGTRTGTSARLIERQEASAQMLLARADLLIERRNGAPPVAQGQPLRCLRF